MSNEVILKQIMREYKFEEPLPENLQKIMYKSKKRTLIKILKENSKYPVFISIIVSFLFWIKKFGITLTLTKSAVILSAITASAALIISTGGYIAVDKIINPSEKINMDNGSIIVDMPLMVTQAGGKIAIIKLKPVIKYKIALKPFKETKRNLKITDLIKKEFIRLRGKDFAVLLPSSGGKKAEYFMSGSVIKLGSIYRISIKVINNKTNKIVSFFSEKTDSKDNIQNACKRIANRISSLIK